MAGMKLLLALASLAPLAIGCGGGGSVDIATTTLAGKIGGQAWTFQAGHTSAFLSEGEPDFFASLYAQAFTACGLSEPSGERHLLVSIPKEVGDYDLSLSLNMTFVDGNENLIATDGRIVVDSVTDSRITGGLHATFDGDNEVDGQFDVTICAE